MLIQTWFNMRMLLLKTFEPQCRQTKHAVGKLASKLSAFWCASNMLLEEMQDLRLRRHTLKALGTKNGAGDNSENHPDGVKRTSLLLSSIYHQCLVAHASWAMAHDLATARP